MPSEIDITIKATDEASGTISKVAANTDDLTQAQNRSADATFNLSQASQLANNIIGSLGQAYAAYNQAIDATIGKTAAYAAEVSSLSRITGQSTEETSRVIQVMDDMGVSAGQLEAVTKKLSADGLSLNISTLADLADEYNTLNPGAERAAFLTDKFGRSGLDMARAMEQGGDALRAMAAEQSGSLVLTEEQAAAYEEWALSVDASEDAMAGLAASIGNALTPAVTEFNNAWAAGINGWAAFITGATAASAEMQKQTQIANMASDILMQQSSAISGLASDYTSYSDVTAEQRAAAMDLAAANYDLMHSTSDMESEAKKYINTSQGMGQSEEELKNIEEARVKAIEKMSAANQDYLSWVGQIASAEQANAETVNGLNEQKAALQQKWEDLQGISSKKRTKDQTTELGLVSEQLEEIDAKITETAANYQEQINQMIAADVLKGLSTNGLTDAETAYFQQIQLKMGLITQEQIDQAAKVKAEVDALLAAAPGAVPGAPAGEVPTAPGAEGAARPDIPKATEDVKIYQAAYAESAKDILINADALIEKNTQKAESTTELMDIENIALIKGAQSWDVYEREVGLNMIQLNNMLDEWIGHINAIPKEVHTTFYAHFAPISTESAAEYYPAMMVG